MSRFSRFLVFLVFMWPVKLTGAFPPSGNQLGVRKTRRDIHCEDPQYQNGNICCLKCPAGYRLVSPCTSGGQRGVCEECEDGTYLEHPNSLKQCLKCTQCRSDQEILMHCTHTQNTECQCRSGRFCAPDQACEVCKKCLRCEKTEETVRNCTPTANTVCKKTEHNPGSAQFPRSDMTSLVVLSVLGAGVVLVVSAVFLWRGFRAKDFQRNQLFMRKTGEHDVSSRDTEEWSKGEIQRPSCSSLILLGHMEDEEFPQLVPVNGEESLKKCFEYFEGVDCDYHKRFFRHLGIADNVIKSKEHLNYEDKIHELLHVWVEKKGREASLNELLKALLFLNQRRTAEAVKENAIHHGHYLCKY